MTRPFLLLVVALALALTACTTAPPVATTPDVPAPHLGTARHAAALLAKLHVGTRGSEGRPYVRSEFGDSWIDTDGNGCNQRDDVLLRDAVRGTVRVGQQGGCDHDVLAGTWHDPYTGRTLRFDDLKDLSQAEAIQIDHIVPLAEAWASGAASWTTDRRHAFANDLTELLAVDGPTNASKGDQDPASWRPKKSYQCRYAIQWIGIKSRWDLVVDASEKRALTEMLGYCR